MSNQEIRRMIKVSKMADKIITPRYEKWLRTHELFPLREDVAERLKQLMVTPPRKRSRSFSGSSSGKCIRAQTYGYIGTPSGETIGPELQAVFHNGTFGHLRLQASFLQAGIINDVSDIEFPVSWRHFQARGTLDGVGTVPMDHPHPSWRGLDFGIEIKTARSNAYAKTVEEGPLKYEHQFVRYFLMTGVDLFVVFMENKDTQEYEEWVVEPNPALMAADREELKILNGYAREKKLPPRLEACQRLVGETFRFCSYGGNKHGVCATINTWKAAEEHRG